MPSYLPGAVPTLIQLPNNLVKQIIIDLKKTPEGREYISMSQAFVKYGTLGIFNLPGGALTPILRSAALRYGIGAVGATVAGVAGEYIAMAIIITAVGTILDPMDYYEGGLMSPAQAETFRSGVSKTKGVLFSEDKNLSFIEREAERFLSPPGSSRKGGGLLPLF